MVDVSGNQTVAKRNLQRYENDCS